jgi:hypothetical protein
VKCALTSTGLLMEGPTLLTEVSQQEASMCTLRSAFAYGSVSILPSLTAVALSIPW